MLSVYAKAADGRQRLALFFIYING
ncbi:hypothetical protein PBAL39_04778 [Pedobacter sp. BAL39]|nr:hypothetical protein PBAL39_04778 [Pedobacter sp. BAL39]